MGRKVWIRFVWWLLHWVNLPIFLRDEIYSVNCVICTRGPGKTDHLSNELKKNALPFELNTTQCQDEVRILSG